MFRGIFFVVLLSWLTLPPRAVANPEKAFAGRALLSDRAFPTSAKSASAFTAALRRQAKDRFAENRATQSWKLHYAAFMRSPLDDLQVTIKIFDLTEGGQRMLTSFEQYTETRGQRALSGTFTLERKDVGVNRRLMLVIECRGKAQAAGRFVIAGQAEKRSGKVDFTSADDEEDAPAGPRGP